MRAGWPQVGLTAAELLAVYECHGPHLEAEALDRIEQADAEDQPPEDKWDPR